MLASTIHDSNVNAAIKSLFVRKAAFCYKYNNAVPKSYEIHPYYIDILMEWRGDILIMTSY